MFYDAQMITNSVVYAGVGNWIVKKLKDSELVPFINKSTYWLNHAVAILTALAGTIGIAYTYTWNPTEGIFQLAFSGLTLTTILAGIKQFLFQYILQQTGYSMTKEKYNGTT